MRIRREQPADYGAVYALVKASFATTSNDGEWDYLNEVRKKPAFVPELSLVAEEDGEIVGQIVLYEMGITTAGGRVTGLVLSPISVHPAHFCRGIATAMMREAFARARQMGYTAVFLCGEPAFYRKIGFRPSWEFGIYHVSDESKAAEWCMVLELFQNALKGIHGTVDIV